MKQKKLFNKPYGLRAHFIVFIVAVAILCIGVFFVLYSAIDSVLSNYFNRSDFIEKHIEWQGESLQEYVDENEISSTNLYKLEDWEHKQPVIMLEIFSDDQCIYSSFYDLYKLRSRNVEYADTVEELGNSVNIQLADKNVWALIYSDFTYRYYTMGITFSLVFSIILFIILFMHSNRKLINYICRLNEEVQILEGGNLEYQVYVEGNNEITDLARSINRMSNSLQQQMESEQEIYAANRKLITEMSHDLRTPLTGIMLYMEIIKSHRYDTEKELNEYLDKISSKLNQMKILSDNLFAYSLKKPSENEIRTVKAYDFFSGEMRSFQEELRERGFRTHAELSWSYSMIRVNPDFFHRIQSNVLSNIIKYAQPDEEIYINSMESDIYSGISILNACSEDDAGDESNGIGIESIRSMMAQMDGICTVEHSDTFFEITLLFKKE